MKSIELFNKSDIVWKYFNDHPFEEITPTMLAEKLKINYNTVNSTINRLYISGKINKSGRGVYMLYTPIAKGQATLIDVIRDDKG
ncbi:MAG: hypothetical protein MIO93_01400 [ANME-2 cluster archaeon]|jgi:Mn-dependent DtxR family transcriptional regulator|nr:hypothetical protein [ANME-2 cluster archaeon]